MTSSAPPGAMRPAERPGGGDPEDVKMQKEQFLLFIRVLMKYLKQKDPALYQQGKEIIRDCAERNRRHEKGYESITNSLRQRLRQVVNESYWTRAEQYMKRFLANKAKSERAAAQVAAPSGTAKVETSQTGPPTPTASVPQPSKPADLDAMRNAQQAKTATAAAVAPARNQQPPMPVAKARMPAVPTATLGPILGPKMSKRTNNDDDPVDQHDVAKKMKMTPRSLGDDSDDGSNDDPHDGSNDDLHIGSDDGSNNNPDSDANDVADDNSDDIFYVVMTKSEIAEESYDICKQADAYYFGTNGVDKNEKMAVKLYQQAANLGHLDSICKLGCCYLEGHGVDMDEKMAVKLYQQAANLGHLDSICKLGGCYLEGHGVDMDKKQAVKLFQQAADQGNLPVIFVLGLCYEHGLGVEKDEKRAVQLYQQAAAQGGLEAVFHLACCYHDGKGIDKDVQMAVQLYQQAADQGHLDSIINLADSYCHGTGVDKDEKKAVQLYQEAVLQGHLQSILDLAVCYEKGIGVEKDEMQAVKLCQQGADQGHLDSICHLANFYRNGIGIDKDEWQAVQLFQQAADQGHLDSLCNLGVCFALGIGVDKDEKHAVKLLSQAADQGHLGSIFNLGRTYFDGSGVDMDEDHAVKLYQQAAHQGNLESIINLACCYRDGTGVDKDETQVFKLCQRAADQGDLDSIFILAVSYENGKDVEKDETQAVKLYKQGADQGHLDSIFFLAHCYLSGTGIDKDVQMAVQLYQQAADQGHFESLFSLAQLYHHGMGVDKDEKKGFQLYQQAADHGHLDSIFLVGLCCNMGTGVDQDDKKAVQLYQQAADLGHVDAIYLLACSYHYGVGVQEDEQKSLHFYQKAADQGHGKSCFHLGFSVWEGAEVNPSIEKAREWFQKGFQSGMLQSVFAYALTFVDNPFQHDLHDLIRYDRVDFQLALSQSYMNNYQQKHSVKEAATAGNKSFLDKVNTSTAYYILAELLASTLDPSYLRFAKELIDQVSNQSGESGYALSKWVSLFIEDQFKEDELWSQVKLQSDKVFDAPRDIQPLALIGEGQFGKVYLSWLRDKSYVAIKYIPIDLADKDEMLALHAIREQLTCRVLSSKNLDNTAKYLGYTDLVDQGKRGLVFELCANLSEVEGLLAQMKEETSSSAPQHILDLTRLPDWKKKVPTSLRSSVVFVEKSKWGIPDVVRMLRETAEALFEVHKLGFIHRDIAPRNILCSENGSIQLADFGLAKYVGSSHKDDAILVEYRKDYLTTGHQYALAWWAPECFGCEEKSECAVFSWNSDVYAFAITMWQCFANDDPFSYVLKRTENKGNAAESIKRNILEGKRPSTKKSAVLDRETPDALIELIVSCWNTDPERRPTLDHIIQSLKQLENDVKTGSTKSRKTFKGGPQKHWHDISSVYQCMKPPKVMLGGTYVEMKHKNDLQAFSHKEVPSANITPSLKAAMNCELYDVFIIHAGEQKSMADTMKNLLEAGNLHCFLDKDMKHGSHPSDTMRAALRTCRYTVVILSKCFVMKKHPCTELQYALDRLMWIRQKCQAWNSLRIIVSDDLSVNDYEELRTQSPYKPPCLNHVVTMKEWRGERSKSWWQVCLELKVSLIEEDQDKKEKAVEKWHEFLTKICQSDPDGFPSGDALYFFRDPAIESQSEQLQF